MNLCKERSLSSGILILHKKSLSNFLNIPMSGSTCYNHTHPRYSKQFRNDLRKRYKNKTLRTLEETQMYITKFLAKNFQNYIQR